MDAGKLFECHVTVLRPSLGSVEREQMTNIAARLHWKTSEIDGDPVLGKHVFFYFTSYGATFEALEGRMQELRRTLESPGIDIKVVRMKIERIEFDWRAEGF